jgi:hypothetical protein
MLELQTQTHEEALEGYLDFIYTGSHSDASVKAYRTALTGAKNGFRLFLKEKHNCHEVQLVTRIKREELNVYRVLRDYVIFLDKRKIKPKSIRLWFAAVKGYLTYLEVEVFSEKCKQLIKLPKVRRLRKEGLTKELILKLLRNLDSKELKHSSF